MKPLKRIFVVFMVSTVITGCALKHALGDDVYPESKDKWGFIDRSGSVHIPATFDYACSFSDGLALVKLKGRLGYINSQGQFVIPPQYNDDNTNRAYPFSDGLARAGSGYIDTTGKVALSPRILQPKVFTDNISTYADGLLAFKSDKGDLWGYMDRYGKTVITPSSAIGDHPFPFSEGMALIFKENNARDRVYGYINKTGVLVIKPQFEDAREFHEGLAIVKKDGKWGYIDKTGQFVIAAKDWDYYYPDYHDFSDGLALVGRNYVDHAGKPVVKLPDSSTKRTDVDGDAKPFTEGLAAVRIGNKWGFMNKQGQVTIAPRFNEARPFANGLAAVRADGN